METAQIQAVKRLQELRSIIKMVGGQFVIGHGKIQMISSRRLVRLLLERNGLGDSKDKAGEQPNARQSQP